MKSMISIVAKNITMNPAPCESTSGVVTKLAHTVKVLLLGIVYGLTLSQPVLADDTEIYTNSSALDPSIRPNVLFLLDTSNSMGNVVTASTTPYIATENYKDTVKYPNAFGVAPCFDAAKVYRINGGDSKAKSRAVGWCASGGTSNDILGIAKIANFFCKNAAMIDQNGAAPIEASNSSGYYKGKVAYYRSAGTDNSKRWKVLNKTTPDAVVDCQADQANHGKYDGNARKYAQKKGGKSGDNIWSTDPLNAFNWNNVARKTTFTGNYLNYLISAKDDATYRIEVIRDVMVPWVNSVTNINLGFMPYTKTLTGANNHSAGAMVEVAIGKVEDTRADIVKRLKVYGTHHDASNPGGYTGHNNLVFGTPSSNQYYEALRYFKGDAPDYGATSTAPSIAASNDCANTPPTGLCADGVGLAVTATDIVSFPSIASSRDADGTYKSPIKNECQANFVILLTDGEPYADPIVPGQLTQMGITDTSCTADPNCATKACVNSCLAKFAEAGAILDKNDTLTEVQPISTFTIAFNATVPILNEATKISNDITGKGQSFTASNADELTNHLRTIIDALTVNSTFSSPAVSVNAFNRSVHLDDLYFTLFKPGKGTHWDGNIKKYKLSIRKDAGGNPVLDSDGKKIPVIVDALGAEAINAAKGFFADGTTSYWSAAADGSEITVGGAVDRFTAARNVYTYTGAYTKTGDVSVPGNKVIITANNKVAPSNKSNVNETLLGISAIDVVNDGLGNSVLLHDALLDWASGIDIFDDNDDTKIDDALKIMGDPLHAQPAIVQYGAAAEDLIAYVATNDGYLHAINTHTGDELWAFIPQELLPLINKNYENVEGEPKSYGLDGNVVAWIDEHSGVEGEIDGTDKVRLYVSQRRGGNRIYALDVTNQKAPQLEWMIEGGVSGSAYEQLGDTWSAINVEKVKDGASSKTVLMFGGGYDTGQDDATSDAALKRHADSVGNAVYIADAETGALLWSAGLAGDLTLSDMKYSIPARVKPLDMSGDGNIDRLYVADMGGQIFRMDLDESTASFSPANIKGGLLADIARDNLVKNARRFYYPPDVAIVAKKGKSAYLGITISSGYRAHPNNDKIHDRIYLFKDRDIYTVPKYGTNPVLPLTESDLYDATLNFASVGDGTTGETDAAVASLESKEGWYISLDDETAAANFVGEKGLAETLIVENTVIVTTFVPESGAVTSACVPKEGSGKVFFLDIFDATAAKTTAADVRADRHLPLNRPGIPASPNVIITGGPDGGIPTTCIGTECQSLEGFAGARRTFWYEVEK